jgi:hypothetical protein
MMKLETAERPYRCDCVKLKRAIQAKIYEETKYMTPEERREHIRKGAERFDEEQRLRRAAKVPKKQTG